MSQTTLPVRSSDPITSYEAALKATLGASKVRPVVLDIVKTEGPLTHDELIGAYNMRVVTQPDTPRSSESGIRTRLKELVHAGLVAPEEETGFSRFGNSAKKWAAVDPDDPRFVYDPDAIVSYISDDDFIGFVEDELTALDDDED